MNKNDLMQELEGTQLLLAAAIVELSEFEVTNEKLEVADKYTVDVKKSPTGNDVLFLREKFRKNGNSH